jgi:rubrerythrin
VRPRTIILGDIAAASGDHAGAIDAWKRIEQQNPGYLALVAQRLLESHRAIGRSEEGLTLLRGYLASFPSLDLLDVAFQSTLDSEGAEAAYKLVKDELRRNQTLLGLDKLLEAQLLVAPAERRHDLELVRNLIHSHTQRLARYHCENCGFKARQFYWHCPACGGWETYPPRRNEEFELTPDPEAKFEIIVGRATSTSLAACFRQSATRCLPRRASKIRMLKRANSIYERAARGGRRRSRPTALHHRSRTRGRSGTVRCIAVDAARRGRLRRPQRVLAAARASARMSSTG